MNKQVWMTLTVIGCTLVLHPHVCMGQTDCTGVDCPVLQNCIEEVLENGACCATCVQRGCMCEGYQYYDCLSSGFINGKVLEGKSYLVDFGSTECMCPKGGGRIECHFIPCPDIPPNCIDLSEPTEGCPDCLRVGCVYKNKKYEAGHSFHMDPCQVCHCPNDGGDLMCSPVPECDPKIVRNHTLPTHSVEVSSERNGNEFRSDKEKGPVSLPTRHHHHHHHHHHQQFHSNSLPLYTENTPNLKNSEDYDYFPEATAASSTEGSIRSSAFVIPAESGSESQFPIDGLRAGSRKELKEKIATYDLRESREEEVVRSASPIMPTTTTLQKGQTVTVTYGKNLVPESHMSWPEPAGGRRPQHNQTERQIHLEYPTHTVLEDKETSNTVRHTHTHKERHGSHQRNEEHTNVHLTHQPTSPRHKVIPKMQLNPTSSPPVKGHEHHREPQTKVHHQAEREEGANDLHPISEEHKISSREVVNMCCEAGEKWASSHGHCDRMEPTSIGTGSVCWTVQKQCCSESLRENKCQAGLTAARDGQACGVDSGDLCAADSYKECCGCCVLGLRLREEGSQCEAPRGLGYLCSYVLRICCEGSDRANWSVIRERAQPQPTTPPRRVSDRPDRQAFSLDDSDNAVETDTETLEGLEDVDECRVYEGQLCQQSCINIPGSYVCSCFPGYALQQDGSSCVQVTPDEENTLNEHDLPTADPKPVEMPSTTPPGLPDPCEGNGPCAQYCTPVAGQALCSCLPGFSLLPDGHLCEDIDECLLSTHTCQANERCINTLGHFTCERQIVCPAGYQVRNNVCEDINECTLGTHNCGTGFECVNTAGSFSCRPRMRCPGGFTHDTQGQCVDIDECRTVSQPCSPGFNCVNTVGSYTCQRKIIMCGRGYHASPDGTRCIDVDECQTGAHQCGEGQQCQNLPGTYRCDCRPGYQYDMFRRMCVDVNECWRYPGRLCAQTCENTPGSYHCSCTSGFTLSSDGKNCEDVNECLNNRCSQECANTYGSFQCYCKQGYYLREDRLTCEDIDECSQNVGHLCAFKCVNVPGSYQCVCPEHGYSMSPNGRSCRDIDECGIGAHNCTADETCYNIQGGFRCLSFSCSANYRRVSDTRCERVSCSNFVECQNTPVRITYYQLSFQTNIIIPAQIFRIGPSPAYAGDNIIISISKGNEEGYFSTRKLNAYTGAIYMHRQVQRPQDFLLDVEMKLWRQGTFTTFLARIYVFIIATVL